MSRKRKQKRDTGARDCMCSGCNAEAHSIPDKRHRKCPNKESEGKRGIWR